VLAAEPPPPPVLTCRDRITSAVVISNGEKTPYTFEVHPKHDGVFGPVAFSGLKDYARSFDTLVARHQWMKSIALVKAGRRATLVVPVEQRGWMQLEYGHGAGRHRITLKACAHELTPFSGGFTIDYAHAPDQGRRAELIVRSGGRELRHRLF
jgi:hypothetical protein